LAERRHDFLLAAISRFHLAGTRQHTSNCAEAIRRDRKGKLRVPPEFNNRHFPGRSRFASARTFPRRQLERIMFPVTPGLVIAA
jgi:hypothetical protein